MLPDYLSAEGEQRCRRLLAEVTVRLRARPAAAAVLVPLCSVRGVPALLYTLRSSRLAGRHKGDVRQDSAPFWRLWGDSSFGSEEALGAGLPDFLTWPRPSGNGGHPRVNVSATGATISRVGLSEAQGLFLTLFAQGGKLSPEKSGSSPTRSSRDRLDLGGKCDPTDRDVVHTALRETHEELGLVVPEEHVWGVLQPVYDQRKVTVVPVLAGVGPLDPQSLRPNPEEVDEVFALPLTHLLQAQNQGYTHFRQGGHFRYTLPVFLHGPHRIWGLTAIITEFTLQLLAPGTYQPRLAGFSLSRR